MKKKIFRWVVNFLYYLPKEMAHKILYKMCLKQKLNLKKPKNFNEKIQWLIVNRYNKNYGDLADKYKVRDYIIKKGYEELLPKLYGVYNSFEEIDFSKLPEEYVLKTNNGCGSVYINTKEEKINFKEAKKNLNKVLKQNFAKKNLEYQYSYIQPKIICEEYLKDDKNKLPYDYKFFCFNGRVECVEFCSERNKKLRLDYYDKNWRYLDYSKEELRSGKIEEKPKNYEKMIEIASKLSLGFEFVRVDLYNINGKIYFGELTFSPACGMLKSAKDEVLEYLGTLINIEELK